MAIFGSKVHCCLSMRYSITSPARKIFHLEAEIATGLPPNLEGSDDQAWAEMKRMSPIYSYPEEAWAGDGGQILVFRVFSSEMISSFLWTGASCAGSKFELQSFASLPSIDS